MNSLALRLNSFQATAPNKRRRFLVAENPVTLADKATYTLMGSVFVFLGSVVAKWLGFLDGGRKHYMDQLNVAIKQLEAQQAENAKARQEHDTKIAVLESKVENLQNSLLESKGMVLQEKAEKTQLIMDLQATRKALEGVQEDNTRLRTENSELREQLAARGPRRRDS